MTAASPRVFIYALVDPRDLRCRYVGKTKVSLDARLRGHLNDAKRRGNTVPRFRWINKLLSSGMLPQVVALEKVYDADWQVAEQMWVREMRMRFPDLLNATAGGDGIHGLVHSPETRLRQSLSAVARYARPGERQKSGDAVRAAHARPETRKRLKAAAAARSSDPAFRQMLSDRQRKYSAMPGVKEARSASLKGRVFSEEWRRKISDSKKGLRPSDETRAKMSAARKGKTHSPETIERMRAARALKRAESQPRE